MAVRRPGLGRAGGAKKRPKNLVKGVGMYAARCARHVSVARASTPCYFSCRLAVRVPREEHTVRRFSRGGLSSPVCRRCGCGISYLLTYFPHSSALRITGFRSSSSGCGSTVAPVRKAYPSLVSSISRNSAVRTVVCPNNLKIHGPQVSGPGTGGNRHQHTVTTDTVCSPTVLTGTGP